MLCVELTGGKVGRMLNIDSISMNAIMNKTFRPRNPPNIYEYMFVVGAYCRAAHWTLVILDVEEKKVFFYNPIQAVEVLECGTIKKAMCGYIALCAGEPEHVIQREWRSSFVRHASQTDSFNCGIFCLIFAEKHMTGAADSLVHITLADLNIMRRKVAKKVMVFEVFLTGCCPKCGMTVDDDLETIPCADCGRSYHFTNYCVEADVERLGDGERFRCTLCRMNYWPRVLRQQQRATNTNQSNFQDYDSVSRGPKKPVSPKLLAEKTPTCCLCTEPHDERQY
ncbi:uncharacterized protein LOC128217699 [Mya arenaria]|uniref:uncharacterized protein LOC128217699 n=1 Tax=Mya arenaria TaxID=6604 RepID=UPI0022E0B420|nr:uncharacterized protein LOC128217699 [Mya arenaria]